MIRLLIVAIPLCLAFWALAAVGVAYLIGWIR